MRGQWFEERREILIRDLTAGFVDGFSYFSTLYREHKEHGKLEYSAIEAWIGSESRKGPLWRLVDLSHSIFRRSGLQPTMYQVLLDWSLGALFHECLRLREDVYQLGHPLQWSDEKHIHPLPDIRFAMEEWERHLAQVRVSLRGGLEEIQQLFQNAWRGLRYTLMIYREMGLVMRYLIENKAKFADLLGEEEWKTFMDELHPYGEADTWFLAGQSYHRSGWFEKAKAAFARGQELCPQHPEVLKFQQFTERGDLS